MWPARYWNPRYWAARFWAKIGSGTPAPTAADEIIEFSVQVTRSVEWSVEI